MIFRVWYSWLILKMHAQKWCTKAATRIFHMMEESFSSLILDIVNLSPRYAKSISFNALLPTVTEIYTLHYLWVKIWSLPNEQLKDNLFYCVEGGGNGIVIVQIFFLFYSFCTCFVFSWLEFDNWKFKKGNQHWFIEENSVGRCVKWRLRLVSGIWQLWQLDTVEAPRHPWCSHSI